MTLNTKHLVLLPTNCRIFDQVRCLIGHKIGFIIQGSNGKFTNIDHWSLERTRYFAHLAPWVLPCPLLPGIQERSERVKIEEPCLGRKELVISGNVETTSNLGPNFVTHVRSWFKLILIWSSSFLQDSRGVFHEIHSGHFFLVTVLTRIEQAGKARAKISQSLLSRQIGYSFCW